MFEGLGNFLEWVRKNPGLSSLFTLLAVVLFVAYEVISSLVPSLTTRYMSEHVEFKTAISGYAMLDNSLNRIRAAYNASRVGLYRFHNGSRDVNRVAYYFVSVATMVGISVDLKDLTDVNAAAYAPIYPNMVAGKAWCSYLKDVADGALKQLESARGTVFMCYVPIFDVDNNLAGLLGIFWTDSVTVPEPALRANMTSALASEGERMSGYFLWNNGRK